MKALVSISDAELAEDVEAVLAAREIEVSNTDSLGSIGAESPHFDIAIIEVAGAESGLEAIRAVRRKGPGVPLLLILPSGTEAETTLLTAGAGDFAVKPVSRSSLDARVSILARRSFRPADVSWHGLPLSTIVESIGDVIEINSPEVVFEYVNPAFEDVMGYTREEAVGSTPAKLLSSGVHDAEFFEEMERTLSSGKTWSGVLVSKRKDGELVHLESTIAPVLNEHGQITHRVAIKRDMTQRLQRERAMRESERRYALAVQGSAEGIWDYHVDTGYAFYSRRWQEIAGVEPGQIEPSLEGWFGRVHPEDRAMVEQKVDDHLSGRTEHLDIEHRLSHGDGTWRWVQIRGVAAREDDIGQRLAGSMSDVTALKLAYQQLEAARDRAVEANRTKSLFLANMSHELRTPLNAIIGYSEMLQEDAEDLGEDQFVSDLDRIKAAASHLLTLINDVLDISKIEAGKMELFLENFDVREVLDGIVNQFRPLIEKSGNTLEFDFGDQLGSMRADLTKFRQTMLNLLGNANKFTDHGTIRFSAHRAEDGLEFVVTDTGIGMTAEQVSKLFHAFVQGDASTTRKYGGTGLGLAISQRFCEMMGGRITVRSREGQGSTFTVRLPVTVRSPRERRQSRAPGEPAMVVLIDDDPSMQELLERSLGKRGIRVRGALNGVEGMRLVRELSPDAIVLDVMMPGMDGWTVLTELKNDLELAHIPVVMLTIVDQRELGIMLGAAEYLLKPVDPDRLTSVLERLRGNEHPAPVLVVEDDPDTQELFRRVLGSDGWDVDVAENGKVALEQLQRGKVPDAILLDLMMPEMDGFEFLAHLRRKPEWVSIPVAVVTAKELTEEDRARLAGSVERVLQKGAYTKEQLCQLVHEVVTAAVGPR